MLMSTWGLVLICLEMYTGDKSLSLEGMVVGQSWRWEDMWAEFVLLDSCCWICVDSLLSHFSNISRHTRLHVCIHIYIYIYIYPCCERDMTACSLAAAYSVLLDKQHQYVFTVSVTLLGGSTIDV